MSQMMGLHVHLTSSLSVSLREQVCAIVEVLVPDENSVQDEDERYAVSERQRF